MAPTTSAHAVRLLPCPSLSVRASPPLSSSSPQDLAWPASSNELGLPKLIPYFPHKALSDPLATERVPFRDLYIYLLLVLAFLYITQLGRPYVKTLGSFGSSNSKSSWEETEHTHGIVGEISRHSYLIDFKELQGGNPGPELWSCNSPPESYSLSPAPGGHSSTESRVWSRLFMRPWEGTSSL